MGPMRLPSVALPVVFAALVTAGCASSPPPRVGADGQRCPSAEQLWPVLQWSSGIGEDAADQLARTLLRSAWLRGFGDRRPRLLLAPVHNRTAFQINSTLLRKLLETRLFEANRLDLADAEKYSHDPKQLAPLRLDAVARVVITDQTRTEGQERVSGFVLELQLVPPGQVSDSGAAAWKGVVRIESRLRPATRPPGCPLPTWVCSASETSRGESECNAAWDCRNGRFELACGPLSAGKRTCHCIAGGKRQPFSTGDVCEATFLGREARRAAVKHCGWQLPEE